MTARATDTPIAWDEWQAAFIEGFLSVTDTLRQPKPYLIKYHAAYESGERSGHAFRAAAKEWGNKQ